MKKTIINKIGIAFILMAGLLLAAPAMAADSARSAPAIESYAPPLGQFYPVTPCRAVDTRIAPRWSYQPMTHYTQRDIWLWGGLSNQGGVIGSCVNSSAEAVAINIVAVPVSGCGGVLSAWAYNSPPPGLPYETAVLNYSACINQAAIANGVIVPMTPGAANEITVWNGFGTTHLVIDVSGYWLP